MSGVNELLYFGRILIRWRVGACEPRDTACEVILGRFSSGRLKPKNVTFCCYVKFNWFAA